MKTTLYSILAAAACGMAFGQTAYTNPVGYVTISIAGNIASNPAGADSYVSPTLILPNIYAGQTNAVAVSNTLTFAGTTVPTNLDSTYMVEIVEGTSQGWWSEITSSTSSSIVTLDNVPSALGANVKIVVRKFQTIKTFLGQNGPGLAALDEVQILNPISQVVKTARWVTNPGEWQDVVLENSMDNDRIFPGTSLKIRIFGTSPKVYVSSGAVKTTKTQVDIYPQSNWVGATLAGSSSMASMNLGPQLLQEDFNAATTPFADDLQLILPTQEAVPYYSVGGVMQNVVTESSSDVAIPIAGGFGIYRDPSAGASILVIPAQSVQ